MINEDKNLKDVINSLYKQKYGNSDSIDSTFQTPLESKMVQLASEAYSSSTNYLQYKRSEWIRHYDMYNSVHINEGGLISEKYHKPNYKLSKMYVPKTHEFVKSQIASVIQAYFSNDELMYFSPQNDSDNLANLYADYLTYYFEEILQRNNWWYQFTISAFEQGVLHNFIPAKVCYDPDKKMPVAKLIPIEDFRLHPGADPYNPIETSPYIINIIKMYVYQVKERQDFEKYGDNAWNKVTNDDYINSSTSFETTVVYARNRNQINPDKKGDTSLNEHSIVYVHENIIKVDGQDYLFYTLGSGALLSKIKKLEEVYLHGRPFVLGNIALEEAKLYPSSVLDNLRHIQEIINELVNVGFDGKKMRLFPRLLVSNTAKIDINALVNARPDSLIFTKDPQKDIQALSVPNQYDAVTPEISLFNSHFDDVSGRFAPSSMAQGDSPDSVGGMQMMNSSANQVSEGYLRTFNETFLEKVVYMMIQVCKHYGFEDKDLDKKLMTNNQLLAKYGITDKKFNINKLKDQDLDININVGMGATNPSMRLERFLTGINSIIKVNPAIAQNLDMQAVMTEIMSIQGYKDPQKFFNMQQNPVVEQLQQQVQQLQAQKEDPQLVAAKVQKIQAEIALINAQIQTEKNKAIDQSVKSQFGAIQAAEVVATIGEVAPVADQILENAGYQAPQNAGQVDVNPQGGGQPFIEQAAPQSPIPAQQSGGLPFNPTGGLITQAGKVAENNQPLNPTNPDRGFNRGLNTQGND